MIDHNDPPSWAIAYHPREWLPRARLRRLRRVEDAKREWKAKYLPAMREAARRRVDDLPALRPSRLYRKAVAA